MVVTTGAAVAGGLAALGSAAAGIFNGLYNASRQDEINARNLANNERLTREAWARDDNAIQRRVADLKAAGLSPVLAAGSGANTTAPISTTQTSRDVDFGDPVARALGALQGKANIAQTNAGTELAKFQSQSEQARYAMMEAQTGVFDAQRQNMALQNQYFAMDMLSKINLRDKQASNLVEQAKLNVAKTAYEQTSLDRLKTEIDNLRTMGDIYKLDRETKNRDLALYPYFKINEFSPKDPIFGSLFKGVNTYGASIQNVINGFGNSKFGSTYNSDWYWDNR